MTCVDVKRSVFLALAGGALLLAGPGPVRADALSADAKAAEALRREIPGLAHLVRKTPAVYLVRVESVVTPDVPVETEDAPPALSTVTAMVLKTLKGRRMPQLTLNLSLRRPLIEPKGGELDAIQKSPIFLSPEKFLSARNPLFAGPWFEKDGTYLLFTDLAGEKLQGGPYGWQAVTSPNAFWVKTVQRLVQNPKSSHAVNMDFADFVAAHRSAFLLLVADCLGTEVVISEPLWGKPVKREEIDPARIHPASVSDCEGRMDEKRAWLGLIEAEPWLYQIKSGYPNQSYVEVRDETVDFSELGVDIAFPDNGRIAVTELAERLRRRLPRR